MVGHRVTRERIARFLQGDWEALHREHVDRCCDLVTTISRHEEHGDDSTASIRRALHLGRSGELSRAARALIHVSLSPRDDTTVAALRVLHPAALGPLPLFIEGFEPWHSFVLDRDCFVRALHTSPSHSSAGIFGGVFEHYQDVLDPVDPVTGFDLLFQLASPVARGDIPTSVAYLLGSSRLIALQKPQGGVRPLAIGEGVYCLISRAICM